MNRLRIVCTADLHIGRSSALIQRAEGRDVSAIGAWERIVELAVAQDADAVVIAGDLFDGRAGFADGRDRFVKGCEQLHRVGVPVFAVAGNHDWDVTPLLSHLAPPNFRFLGRGGDWEVVEVETKSGPIRVLGWSFPAEQEAACQLERLERRPSGVPTIGLVHGDPATDSVYHPLSAQSLLDKCDVWVLGHIHKPTALHPFAIFPGSPQALDFGPGERGAHGVHWLEFEAGRPTFSKLVPLSTVRYEVEELVLDLNGEERPVERALEHASKICQDRAAGLQISVQLRLEVVYCSPIRLETASEEREYRLSHDHMAFVSGIRWRPKVDPWQVKDLKDSRGHAARLLLGSSQIGAEQPDPRVDPGWIEAASNIIDSSASDLQRLFESKVRVAAEAGENGILPLAEAERMVTARRWVQEELELMLMEDN